MFIFLSVLYLGCYLLNESITEEQRIRVEKTPEGPGTPAVTPVAERKADAAKKASQPTLAGDESLAESVLLAANRSVVLPIWLRRPAASTSSSSSESDESTSSSGSDFVSLDMVGVEASGAEKSDRDDPVL